MLKRCPSLGNLSQGRLCWGWRAISNEPSAPLPPTYSLAGFADRNVWRGRELVKSGGKERKDPVTVAGSTASGPDGTYKKLCCQETFGILEMTWKEEFASGF